VIAGRRRFPLLSWERWVLVYLERSKSATGIGGDVRTDQ